MLGVSFFPGKQGSQPLSFLGNDQALGQKGTPGTQQVSTQLPSGLVPFFSLAFVFRVPIPEKDSTNNKERMPIRFFPWALGI